jgi:hypothetical protein
VVVYTGERKLTINTRIVSVIGATVEPDENPSQPSYLKKTRD